MPVTVSRMNRKKDRPPRQNVYVSFSPCRFILTGCRWYSTLFIVASARSREVSRYPRRKIDPGRKIDFQTSVSRTRSRASLGVGSFSFATSSPSSLPGLAGLGALRLGHRGHRALSARGLRQPRIVQGVGGAPVHAHLATGARVVVDDEHRVGAADLGPDGVVLRVPHDVRRHHVDAVPRADVFAGSAQDAVVGVE